MRHWGNLIALGLLVAAGCAYHYVTDAERVRAQAERYLGRFLNADVQVSGAEFSFFHGVHLIGVEVHARATPDETSGKRATETDPSFAFYCRDLLLKHDPLRALIGRLAVDEVVALNPACRLIRDADTGRFNIGDLFVQQPARQTEQKGHLPVVRLRDASFQLLSRNRSGTTAVERLTLDLLAVPEARQSSTYRIRWSGGGEDRSQGRTTVNLSTFSIVDEEGGLPWVSLEAVMLAADSAVPGAARYCELLGLSGEVRAEDYDVAAANGNTRMRKATIRLRHADLSVPIDEHESALPADERYLRFRDVNGTVEFDATGAKAEFTARFHSSECTVAARLLGQPDPDAGLEPLGFDVELACTDLRLPARDGDAPAAEARFVNRWRKFRHFYRDFDPHGTVSVSFAIAKAPGKDEPVQLRGGRLIAAGCDAAYRFFPYRVENLHGDVEFTKDGVFLRDLTGEHAGAPIVVNGWLEGPHWHSAARLNATGTSVPLDADLRTALNESYQRLWSPFALAGRADIHVQLERAAGEPGQRQPWTTHIEADLRDATACFAGFPYPVDQLTGRVEVDREGLRVSDLIGKAGDGTVLGNGQAVIEKGRLVTLELTLQASEVAFGDSLMSALPPDARDLVDSFAPQGRFDLSGRVTQGPDDRDPAYDFQASLRDVGVTYRGFPLPVEQLSGAIRLRPRKIDIVAVEGRHGPAVVRATGSYETTPSGSEVHLTVGSRGLHIDEGLRDHLPASLRATLDAFDAIGTVHTTTHIDRTPQTPESRLQQRTEADLELTALTFAPFPLPLSNVRGTVVVEGNHVRLDRITAEHEGAQLGFSGEIARENDTLRGTLRVRGSSVPLDEDLRRAVPWRWRRTWNNVTPQGRFDIDLTRLSFEREGDQPMRWSFEGALSPNGVALDLGARLTGIVGKVSGSGAVGGAERGLSFAGPVDLREVFINDRRVANLRGALEHDGQAGRTVVTELVGELYGGNVTGEVELKRDGTKSRYAASATLNRVDVREFLNAGRKEELPPIDARGLLDARIYLSGTSGATESRRGGGRVRIYEANLFRLPLLAGITNVLNLTLPDADTIHEASAEFFLTGRQVELRDIVLQGPALTLAGSGSLRVEDQSLELRLITSSPREWGRVPVLSELLEGTGRELIEITVRGTLGSPSIEARPLRGVSGAIETLIQPRRDD